MELVLWFVVVMSIFLNFVYWSRIQDYKELSEELRFELKECARENDRLRNY